MIKVQIEGSCQYSLCHHQDSFEPWRTSSLIPIYNIYEAIINNAVNNAFMLHMFVSVVNVMVVAHVCYYSDMRCLHPELHFSVYELIDVPNEQKKQSEISQCAK